MNYVAGGVGKALIFAGTQLYGIANTLSDNTFDFTITAEDIRGGKKNVLLAQYFHDPIPALTCSSLKDRPPCSIGEPMTRAISSKLNSALVRLIARFGSWKY